MRGRPKYFNYAVRGNLIVLVTYLDSDRFIKLIRENDQYEFKQTGRRKRKGA